MSKKRISRERAEEVAVERDRWLAERQGVDVGAETMSAPVEHKIVEAMASSWDEPGYRPPWNWRVTCSCGWSEREFKTQIDASDAWRAHVEETP